MSLPYSGGSVMLFSKLQLIFLTISIVVGTILLPHSFYPPQSLKHSSLDAKAGNLESDFHPIGWITFAKLLCTSESTSLSVNHIKQHPPHRATGKMGCHKILEND